ncbi:hypothetical protein SH139x_002201 [Planctomycetaceae bacterium SH139]
MSADYRELVPGRKAILQFERNCPTRESRRTNAETDEMICHVFFKQQLLVLAVLVLPLRSATAQQEGTTRPGAGLVDAATPSVILEEPKPELARPTAWGEPTEVEVGIYVIDVDEVNSADQSFAASVYFQAQWNNPLLAHEGPGPKLRSLTDVWNPRLTIMGQQMIWRSYPEYVEIQPDGTVVYRQKVWGRFSQPLSLQDFPFDEQELSIHIVAAGLLENDVRMVPLVTESGATSGTAETFSLPDFDVVSDKATVRPYSLYSGHPGTAGFELRMKIDRRPMYYILKVIIPLGLIVVMSWLPRWIAPSETGTNIGISTSAFLTLVAYLFAITVLLPRVSYVTRMDSFILLSTLMVFAGLIQSAWNAIMIGKQKQKTAEIVGRWSRIAYPLLLIFVIVYSFAM